jgi:hypothetical protein
MQNYFFIAVSMVILLSVYGIFKFKINIAKRLFILIAIAGVVFSAGTGLLCFVFAGVAASKPFVWIISSAISVTLSAFWLLFSYGAYKGLNSNRLYLKIVFWLFVIVNIVFFPIGTIFAISLIYLWREVNKTEAAVAA